jgi:hypothetical protein
MDARPNVIANEREENRKEEEKIKLTEADLDLIESMASQYLNASLAVCGIASKVKSSIEKGEKISTECAEVIKTVAERNPNSALAQSGVQERAMESADVNKENQAK